MRRWQMNNTTKLEGLVDKEQLLAVTKFLDGQLSMKINNEMHYVSDLKYVPYADSDLYLYTLEFKKVVAYEN